MLCVCVPSFKTRSPDVKVRKNPKNNKSDEAFAYKGINNLSVILEMFWIDDPHSASTFVPVTAAPGFEASESSPAWPIAPFSRHL